jgi:DNA-binding response OmpR family regulator
MMPELDGFEVCRRLKSQTETQDIPVIFTTALTDIADKVKGFEVGAIDYITKPFQAAEVLARLRTHLTVHQLKQRLLARSENLQVHNLALKKKIEMLSHQT